MRRKRDCRFCHTARPSRISPFARETFYGARDDKHSDLFSIRKNYGSGCCYRFSLQFPYPRTQYMKAPDNEKIPMPLVLFFCRFIVTQEKENVNRKSRHFACFRLFFCVWLFAEINKTAKHRRKHSVKGEFEDEVQTDEEKDKITADR